MGAALVVSVGALLWARGQLSRHVDTRHAPTTATSAVSDEVKRLQRVAEDLQGRVDRAETLISQRPAGPASVAVPAPATAPVVDEAEEALRRLPPQERDRLLASSTMNLLEETVQSGVVDRRWTTRASAELNERLAAPEFAGTRVSAVECVTDVCRFRVQHDSAEAREHFMPALSAPPLVGNAFFHYDAAEKTTVVYVAREGQALPKVDLTEVAAREGR
jgi:hypothetical protein